MKKRKFEFISGLTMPISVRILVFIFIAFTSLSIIVQDSYNDIYEIDEESEEANAWLEKLSLEEKIGQVFMVPVYSAQGTSHRKEIQSLIDKYHIGGLIFMKGHPYAQYQWTNGFQKKSKTPLLIAMDAEWGLSMRLDSVIKYPKQMTMGAFQKTGLIREFSQQVAQQMQHLGVNVSFSPVVDINSNPDNPVIHMRSFGEDKYEVSNRSLEYLRGLQENGILAVAKHFPGHGDTDVDSHKDLPVVLHNKKRLNKVELFPYKKLLESGLFGVMSAHIYLPTFTRKKQIPSSFSPQVLDKLLRRRMGFKGLIFSDALNMKGAADFVDPTEIDLQAFLAGNDILLFPSDIPNASEQIKKGIENGEIPMKVLDEKVLRILKTKRWIEKHNKSFEADSAEVLQQALNPRKGELLLEKMAKESITLLGNKKAIVPFTNLAQPCQVLSYGAESGSEFEYFLSKYGSLDIQRTDVQTPFPDLSKLDPQKKLVIALHAVNPYKISTNFGYSQKVLDQVSKLLSDYPRAVLVNFGSPYVLRKFLTCHQVLQCYEELPSIQKQAAQSLYGVFPLKASLPVTALYPAGSGKKTQSKKILGYASPESVGLTTENLNRIHYVAEQAIRDMAMPGCQVLVAKDGKIVFDKAYGYHTYDSIQPVTTSDLYDLASITKVMASTLMVMDLSDKKKLDINKNLGEYLDTLVAENKRDLSLKEILCHQAGLPAWIPFYKKNVAADGSLDSNFNGLEDSIFTLHVGENLFSRMDLPTSIWQQINEADQKTRGKYLYSDLGYYYLIQLLRNMNNGEFENYLYQNFYQPLGMNYTTFNPLDRFMKNEIVPTEDDDYFRNQRIHGYVHDPGAAMMGGVAGHAGLFSNASDVAKLFQLFLQKGKYGSQKFLSPSVISTFTSKQYETNRKGIGFDKPEKRQGIPGPLIPEVSPSTFGHTGFTGTCVWADPKHQLVYVFLSNRIHPSADNKKLIYGNVRTNILGVIYDELETKTDN